MRFRESTRNGKPDGTLTSSAKLNPCCAMAVGILPDEVALGRLLTL